MAGGQDFVTDIGAGLTQRPIQSVPRLGRNDRILIAIEKEHGDAIQLRVMHWIERQHAAHQDRAFECFRPVEQERPGDVRAVGEADRPVQILLRNVG